MPISANINQYIEQSKVQGRFLKWDKPVINVLITSISAPITNKEFLYSEVRRALGSWNLYLAQYQIPLMFNETQTPSNADIIIHWTKVGRVFEGMCKYPGVVNGILKKISIDIGLKNEYSPKNTTQDSIYFVMMHELGHSLGLGHGIDIDDLMYVPHQKNIATPSENDMFVIQKIYNIR